jgi:hypothetical protein
MSSRLSPDDRPPDGQPEHWEADADDGDVVQLNIPDDPRRDRRFEIFCSFSVDSGGRSDAWHAMRVLVNGAQEWQRREQTHPGGRDSLDYRFRRFLPAGEALRLAASTEVQGARRLGLRITADED